jgi:gamma-glutamyltranspeptidase/glutathione hydrolase
VLAPSTSVIGPAGSGAVAAGSHVTADAAAQILRQGGNAIDAIVAAGFAGAVSEPGLSGLGGGGFCLYRRPGQAPALLDFFVNAPGRGREPGKPIAMDTIEVQFEQTTQIFHAGWGSVAVPGAFAGYLALHSALGRLPLEQILQPAIHAAQHGVEVEPVTALDLQLVGAALGITEAGRRLCFSDGAPKVTGDVLRNPDYARLLQALGAGDIVGPHDPQYVAPLADAMREHGGALTAEDMQAYQPVHRTPMEMDRLGQRIFTNAPPSFGGAIVVRALRDFSAQPTGRWVALMKVLVQAIAAQREHDLHQPDATQVSRGTTHMSVIDGDGFVAALTISVGTGSGIVTPGWGVMLNNMAGEEDLHPAGLGSLTPGTRMGSMMAPTIIESADGTITAFGTGGSERIRSTTSNLLLRLIDDGATLSAAVDAPRVHIAPDGVVHIEPGLESDERGDLTQSYPVQEWRERDFYFGGVHAVRRHPDGVTEAVGDGRRGGVAFVVPPQ